MVTTFAESTMHVQAEESCDGVKAGRADRALGLGRSVSTAFMKHRLLTDCSVKKVQK